MVELNGIKNKYNLNVNMSRNTGTPQLNIGAAAGFEDTIITFFDRNQVLTGGLDKYPVLRGITQNPTVSPVVNAGMAASGIDEIEAVATIYKGTEVDNDEILCQCSVNLLRIIQNVEIMWVISKSPISRKFKGGTLLPDQILIRVTINTDVVVAGANLLEDQVAFVNMFEIDWVPITKKELQETVVEQVYADQ